MIPVVPKVLAADRQGAHYHVAVRSALAKCRGSFDTVTVEKNAPIGDLLKITCDAIGRFNALVIICLCVLGTASEKALAQAQVTGQWVTLPYLMSINPIRVDLLRNGWLCQLPKVSLCPAKIFVSPRGKAGQCQNDG